MSVKNEVLEQKIEYRGHERHALLLLDGVRVGRSLGGVDELVGNCLRARVRKGE